MRPGLRAAGGVAASGLVAAALTVGAVVARAADDEALAAQRAAYAERSGELVMHFAAEVAPDVPIAARPLETAKRARRDVPYQVLYRFTNLTGEPQSFRAAHQFRPELAEDHVRKLVCFCFENQTLAPYESRDLPVVFTVDANLAKEVDAIELAYVIFRSTPKYGPAAH